jgi:hypothetical protein
MTHKVMALAPADRHDRHMEPITVSDPIAQLRIVLTANAITSGLAGLGAVVAGESIADWLDSAHAGWVRVVGAGLVVFAFAVVALSRSNEQHLRRWVPAVSAADAAWVAASVATIVAGWYSTRGAITIGVMAAVVAAFALAQMQLVRTPVAPSASRPVPG